MPWFNTDLRKLKKLKDKSHKKAKTSNTQEHWQTFRQIRNIYIDSLKQAEQSYKDKLAHELKTTKNINPKKWWNLSNIFLGNKKNKDIPPMEKNDKCFFSDTDKSNAFNDSFLNSSKLNYPDNINFNSIPFKTDARLENITVTLQEIIDIILSLDTSKATGPDGISAKMLKETARTIAPSLTRLINLSLSTSIVPQGWKQANVIPIHKKNEKSNFDNYRPISLLNITSKICEKAIFKHVFNYIQDNSLLSIHQSGFTPGDSTVNQLAYLYNVFCKALNDKKDIRIVFCDQSKAFDRVWHFGLKLKLKSIGITKDLLSWFENYLNNRQQRVIIKGSFSKWGKIEAGVPQGSVLGPLLFLIYINDITDNIKSNIKLFADDTSLFVTIDQDEEVKTKELNEDLCTIDKWAKRWLVTFNPSKTKSMYITLKQEKQHPPLLFDGHTLDSTNNHKHLGLTFNSTLTWKEHIENITTSANKKLALLNGLKHLLDRQTLLTMYLSFIRPKLEYANTIWINCTESESDQIESIQRRAARIITGGIIRTPSNLLYNEIALEPLKARRERNALLLLHKINHNNCPDYLSELKPQTTQERTQRTLRSNNKLVQPNCRITKYQKSFLPMAIKLWNNLPTNTSSIENYKSFKIVLESNIPKKNPLFYIGSRSENIVMAKLRMESSNLNFHLTALNIIDDPSCICGNEREDPIHYFFQCPLYMRPRAALHNAVSHLAPFTLKTLLFGRENLDIETNRHIISSTIAFIKTTERFKK